MLLRIFDNDLFIEVPEEDVKKICPTCHSLEYVRIAGKKENVQQYLCTFDNTYFFPHTVANVHKKIWHDKIKWKKLRMIEYWLGSSNVDNIRSRPTFDDFKNINTNSKNSRNIRRNNKIISIAIYQQ